MRTEAKTTEKARTPSYEVFPKDRGGFSRAKRTTGTEPLAVSGKAFNHDRPADPGIESLRLLLITQMAGFTRRPARRPGFILLQAHPQFRQQVRLPHVLRCRD